MEAVEKLPTGEGKRKEKKKKTLGVNKQFPIICISGYLPKIS